ncbi:MAG TPA: hypothetical protein VFT13_03220, partial [Candidatus Krumholzibacteria bacterium]|nr:hypothetical protein [Candidatus Krumholzibacteria bacterium]
MLSSRHRLCACLAIIAIASLATAGAARAQAFAGAPVLQDPISARATAMGFTGAADNSDPANIWFNPANAVGATGVYAEYAFWDLVPFPTFELPLERWALGGSFRLSNSVDMGVSTTFGELDYGTTYAYDTMGNIIPFESWERYASLALAVATRVDKRVDLRLGAAFKRVWAEYAPPSFVQPPYSVVEGDGIACDVGTAVAVPTELSGWAVTPALGFAYVNFGGEIDCEDRGFDPFPARLHYGASIRVDGPDFALGPARVPLLSFVQNVDVVDRLHGDSYSWG